MKKFLLLAMIFCSTPVFASSNFSTDLASLIDNDRNFFDQEVKESLPFTDEEQDRLFNLVKEQLKIKDYSFSTPQLILIVDRGIHKQDIAIALVGPDEDTWNIIGETHVSTGKPGRKEHFKTPTGIFFNDGSILGYRAEGTYNENHIRGLGVKGMRVWDFGWQTTEDWRTHTDTMKIRMEMHATDPSVLAPRIGRPDSEGCIRIPADMNVFLDHNGIIDKDLEEKAETQRSFKALLGKEHHPLEYNGNTIIIVDGG